MSTKRKMLCPYLDSSHSKAVLSYLCLACKEGEVEINPGDIASMPCSSSRHKNCRHYKNARKAGSRAR